LEHYDAYPSTPDAFPDWRRERDRIMDDIYAETGAEPKY
jgi:electron-transferring-flavoprotein dehydrogenase